MTHFEEMLRYGGALVSAGITYRKLILEHLQRLAQLSTVDGALIFPSAFELVGFGPGYNPLHGMVNSSLVQMGGATLAGRHSCSEIWHPSQFSYRLCCCMQRKYRVR